MHEMVQRRVFKTIDDEAQQAIGTDHGYHGPFEMATNQAIRAAIDASDYSGAILAPVSPQACMYQDPWPVVVAPLHTTFIEDAFGSPVLKDLFSIRGLNQVFRAMPAAEQPAVFAITRGPDNHRDPVDYNFTLYNACSAQANAHFLELDLPDFGGVWEPGQGYGYLEEGGDGPGTLVRLARPGRPGRM